MTKRIISFLLAVIFVLVPLGVSGQDYSPFSLQWAIVSRCGANLAFSGTTCDIKCHVTTRYTDATISGLAILYENGNEIASWEMSGTHYCYIIETIPDRIPGCAYYCVTDVTVYHDGEEESVLVESEVEYCPDAD